MLWLVYSHEPEGAKRPYGTPLVTKIPVLILRRSVIFSDVQTSYSDVHFLFPDVQFLFPDVQFLFSGVQFLFPDVQFLFSDVQFLFPDVQFLFPDVQFLIIRRSIRRFHILGRNNIMGSPPGI